MITDSKMKFWIDNNLNVLFIGHAGVGKTARVKKAFDESGLKWLYFSAATLDPWVDFIGIPKESQDEKGNKFIELIRPKPFAEDEVEAIFLDEFNRAKSKVRNAVMELLQFKSINGKRFNKLRVVWAAINPENKTDDNEMEYDVEKLDPAQRDRFEIQVEVPYKPDRVYFNNKFGSDISVNAIDWWNDLTEKEKMSVSPRRLDYTLDVYVKGGDIRDVLPQNINVSKLLSELKNGSFVRQMTSVFQERDVEKARTFMSVRNNYDNTIGRIIQSNDMINFFLPVLKEEDLVVLMSKDNKAYEHVVSNYDIYNDVIKNLIDVNSNSKLSKKLKKEPKLLEMTNLLKKKMSSVLFNKLTFSNSKLETPPNAHPSYSQMYSSLGGQSLVSFINDNNISNTINKGTQYRVGIYYKILSNMSVHESFDSYTKILDILGNIIVSSHKTTLTQTIYKGLPQLFGHIIFLCKTTYNKDVKQILSNIKTKNINKLEDFILKNSELYA